VLPLGGLAAIPIGIRKRLLQDWTLLKKIGRLAANHLAATLDKFKVPEKEKNEVFAFVTSLKKDIVEK